MHRTPASAPPLAVRLWHDPAWHLAILFALATACGGGGVGQGLPNLVVQLAALAVMALHPRAFVLFFMRSPGVLALLVGLSVLVPVLQLVPLPPALWTALPGRDLVAASLQASGTAPEWYTFSVFPARTLTAAIGTLTPLVIIVVGSTLPARRLAWLAQVIAGFGVLAMLFGSLHLINPSGGYLYQAAHDQYPGALVGTFADRNAGALFLVSCLTLLFALPAEPLRTAAGMARVAGGALLLVGTVLTQSRTGTALLLLPLGLLVFRTAAHVLTRSGRRRLSLPVAAGVVLATMAVGGIGAMALSHGGRASSVLSRFENAGDGKRAEMREDALTAVAHYWPAGAGMGTFDEVFQVDESLEYLSPRRAGRAHMDYYELAIEAGIAGLIIAALWALWALTGLWRALARMDAMGFAGGAILVGIAAQSVLSFPLRNQTMLAIAAFAVVALNAAMAREGRTA